MSYWYNLVTVFLYVGGLVAIGMLVVGGAYLLRAIFDLLVWLFHEHYFVLVGLVVLVFMFAMAGVMTINQQN